MSKLVSIKEYIQKYHGDDKPTTRMVRYWLQTGKLKGFRLGHRYWIQVDDIFKHPTDTHVGKILEN